MATYRGGQAVGKKGSLELIRFVLCCCVLTVGGTRCQAIMAAGFVNYMNYIYYETLWIQSRFLVWDLLSTKTRVSNFNMA